MTVWHLLALIVLVPLGAWLLYQQIKIGDDERRNRWGQK